MLKTEPKDGSAIVVVPAVILAAGLGVRLSPLTVDRPKALVEVGGRSLLERLLDNLHAAGVREIRVVTGHLADRVANHPSVKRYRRSVQLVHNPDFRQSNNIVSFLVGTAGIETGCILLNSDIIVDQTVVSDLAKTPGSHLVIDLDEPLGHEEMKVQIDGEGFLARISKELDAQASAGEYIGALRLDAPALREVRDEARRLVADGRTGLYYEHAIDASAARLRARILPVRGRVWTEVDDQDDFVRAQRVARSVDA